MAIVRPLGATSSSSGSKSDGILDDAWDVVKGAAKGAARGGVDAVGKKLGMGKGGGNAPPPVYAPPPPEPKKEAFHETIMGKVLILAAITKAMKVW